MNVVLIQPPDPPNAVRQDMPEHDAPVFSPPWGLLCLQAYLLKHTRHHCFFIDCRFYSHLEMELIQGLAPVPQPMVAVVNTSSHALGQTAAILEIIKRQFPDVVTVVCGQHPSQFPEHFQAIPRADFALSGDAEPILRNLLDYIDVEQRLRRVPGLLFKDRLAQPYWLNDLKSLSLPDWTGIFWNSYAPTPSSPCRVEARLSRGHTRCPADRAFGDVAEPFRFWPFDRVASSLQKCGCLGIGEVFLTDPPGIWTPALLHEWCSSLLSIRNVQPWGMQLLPTIITEDVALRLSSSLCRRVDILFPSCDGEVLKHYGCLLPRREIARTMAVLQRAGIQVHSKFWIGGPEERSGEAERIKRLIRFLGFGSFSLHPFPFLLDSPIYSEFVESVPANRIEDWIQWSRDPWMEEKPVPVWGGIEATATVTARIRSIRTSVRRHPERIMRRFFHRLMSVNWITAIEEKALDLMKPT